MSSPDNPPFEPQPPNSPPNSDPQASLPLVSDSFPAPAFLPAPPAPKAGEDPVWSGWDVLQIAGLTVVSVIVLQLVILFGAKRLIYRHLSFGEIAQVGMLVILAQFVAYIAVAIYMVSLVEGKYHVRFWPAIRWNWPGSPRKVFGWGVFGVLVLFATGLLSHFLPMPKSTPFESFFKRPMDAYVMSVFAISFGPLMEELFFRGFLYPVLARRMGAAWGILLTALPFGLMHMFQYGYAWGVVLLIFLMGVVCTAVRAATGSVAASFLVHVGYNATDMFVLAVATNGFRHMEKAGVLLAYLKG